LNVVIYNLGKKQHHIIKILEGISDISIYFAFEIHELFSIKEKYHPAMIFGTEDDFGFLKKGALFSDYTKEILRIDKATEVMMLNNLQHKSTVEILKLITKFNTKTKKGSRK